MRVEPNGLSRIRILGAPGPDWDVVATWTVPGLSFRSDPGFLHVWLQQQRFELPGLGVNQSFKATPLGAAQPRL
jgi:hypothetical protein